MTTKITEKNISSIANTAVQWQTVHVADGSTALTTSAGKGYFIDTSSATQTVNLPSVDDSTFGDTIIIKDFARTFGSNGITIASNTLDGEAAVTSSIDTTGASLTIVFSGSTKGWQLTNDDTTGKLGPQYISATGGTVTETGNFKVHTFTGDGCFVVSSLGSGIPSDQANKVDYLVVAGGGSGGGTGPSHVGAGGGAGGYRESAGTIHGPYTVSPLGACVSGLPVSAGTTYPITVGGGGAASGEVPRGNSGSNSVFSTITSAGGGGGGSIGSNPAPSNRTGGDGGSGGGGSSQTGAPGGSGNTPPVSPPQGSNGAAGIDSPPNFGGGGGGGATQAGTQAVNPGPVPAYVQGGGGAGGTSCITGSPVARAGGGGAGGSYTFPGKFGAGGTGGGGNGGNAPGVSSRLGVAGTANTGGGGGGAAGGNPATGEGGERCSGAGGKGVVILRYKFQS
jgi:hypothetical protein